MRRFFYTAIISTVNVFPVLSQTISDTSFIRMAEILSTRSELQQYRNYGSPWKGKEVLVISDFRNYPVMTKSQHLPSFIGRLEQNKYSICQYNYIKDNKIKNYVVPE